MPLRAQDMPEPDTVTSAPGLTIETSVDQAEIYIGDLITYTLSIIHDSTIILTPPPIGANLGAFDVKDYQVDDEEKLESGQIKSSSRFRLTTFTTGDYVIPPIPVEFMLPDSTKKILISEPVAIRVKSLLAESADTADIRDIKAPVSFKSGLPWYYFVIGGAILILVLSALYWYWKKRQKTGPTEPVDTRKPWEIAFEALAYLKEKNYPAAGEYKQYYVELTEIVRGYLQRIYDIPVLDMTTYEFLTAMRENDVDDSLYERFKEFLEYADLVKFAKLIPPPDRMEADFEEAFNIIEYIRQIELSKIVPEEVPVSVAGGEGGGHV